MICRFCGYPPKTLGQKLRSSIGEKCVGNPEEFHVAMPEQSMCVYCGNKVSSNAGKLRTSFGLDCPNSPTKMHCLI